MANRVALSRVLTEIIFLVLGVTTAIGAYSVYNSSISSGGQIVKIVCTDTSIVTGAQEIQVTVKNLGNVAVNVHIDSVSVYDGGNALALSGNYPILLEPGMEKMVSAKCSELVAGVRYRVFVIAKIGDDIAGYDAIESVALP